jgi:hypothetical protein
MPSRKRWRTEPIPADLLHTRQLLAVAPLAWQLPFAAEAWGISKSTAQHRSAQLIRLGLLSKIGHARMFRYCRCGDEAKALATVSTCDEARMELRRSWRRKADKRRAAAIEVWGDDGKDPTPFRHHIVSATEAEPLRPRGPRSIFDMGN